MTFVSLTPNSTGANTGAVTGTNAHSALSDGSDSTYVDFDYGEAATLGLTDLTLPAGAQLVSAQVLARVAKLATGPSALNTVLVADSTKTAQLSVTSVSPVELGGAFSFDVTDAGLDAATIGIYNTALSGLRAYEASVRVLYFAKPTLSVITPTGTISTNQIAVEWTPSFDVHATTYPAFYRVKIFSSAQYGAGGFDPETSTAVLDTGELQSSFYAHAIRDTWLPNGVYRAYVKIAAPSASSQWSDWAYSGFTVSVPTPATPTMTLTAGNSLGRIGVGVVTGGGTVSTDYVELQRSADGGLSFNEVRTSLGGGSVSYPGGTVTTYDYEAPNGGTVVYRARAYHGGTPGAYSNWTLGTTVWSSDVWWLKHPFRPSLNRQLTVRGLPGWQQTANQGVFRPLGSSNAVVVQDVRGPVTGDVTVLTDNQDARDDLAETLGEVAPMLLQGPLAHGIPERWVAFGDLDSSRIVNAGVFTKHDETLGWTEVDRPSGALQE